MGRFFRKAVALAEVIVVLFLVHATQCKQNSPDGNFPTIPNIQFTGVCYFYFSVAVN
jgi:hypothetical protein